MTRLLKRDGKFLKIGGLFATDSCVGQCCCDVEGDACLDPASLLPVSPVAASEWINDPALVSVPGYYPDVPGVGRKGAMRIDLNGFQGTWTAANSGEWFTWGGLVVTGFDFTLGQAITICEPGGTDHSWSPTAARHVSLGQVDVSSHSSVVLHYDNTALGEGSGSVAAHTVFASAVVAINASWEEDDGTKLGPSYAVWLALSFGATNPISSQEIEGDFRWAVRYREVAGLELDRPPFPALGQDDSRVGWAITSGGLPLFAGSSSSVVVPTPTMAAYVCESPYRPRTFKMTSADAFVLGVEDLALWDWITPPDFGVHVELTVFETDLQKGWIGTLGGSLAGAPGGVGYLNEANLYGPFDNNPAVALLSGPETHPNRVHCGITFPRPIPTNAEIVSVFAKGRWQGARQGHTTTAQWELQELQLNSNVLQSSPVVSLGNSVSTSELLPWDETLAQGEYEWGGPIATWGLTAADFTAAVIGRINAGRFGVQWWWQMESSYPVLPFGQSTTLGFDGMQVTIVYKDPAFAALQQVTGGCCG